MQPRPHECIVIVKMLRHWPNPHAAKSGVAWDDDSAVFFHSAHIFMYALSFYIDAEIL